MHRLAAALFAASCLVGCASAPPTRTSRMTELGVGQTTAEIRVYLREYLRGFNTEIAAAADDVLVIEKDLAVQEAALRLKANAVTAMQAAVFQRDPLAAITDAWALTAAMRNFFEDGKGKALFAGSQSRVVAVLQTLEGRIDEFAQTVVGKERVEAVRPEIYRFVRENPIRDLSLGIRSAGLQASVLAAAGWSTDVRRSVTQIEETARDLSDRLTIYAEQLPQIVRWQSEIVLIETRREVLAKPFADLDGLDRNFAAIVKDVDAVTELVTGTPALIAEERTHLQDALDRERAAILASVDGQRVATLAAVTAEREAILAAVEELRKASFRDLGTETQRSLDRMDKLSAATVQDLGRLSSEAIDRLFWRALELLLAGVTAFGLLALAWRHTTPRTRA
jgi:hypothetical protein